MTRETLDETLDRVAAEITAVPPDPTFVARLRPRLDEAQSYGLGLKTIAAAACVLALAIAASLVRNGDPGTHPSTTVARSGSGQPTTTSVETSPGEREPSPLRVDAVTATRQTSRAGSTGAEVAHAGVVSTIPALSSPSDLAVAHLELDPLVVHPVDVSDLEVAGLSVTELGDPEDPKE